MIAFAAHAQSIGDPDDEQPGDEMIQAYLKQETDKIESNFLGDIKTAADWENARPKFRQEYFEMLGLAPMPEKTPLHATVTGTLTKPDFIVDMLHFQSRPGLYVTCNLYRPSSDAKSKLPTVLYVCGHTPRGRNGNKTAYQSHGMWFARHGYNCLVVDTLQLGEVPGIHHGTYSSNLWTWVSRGYTPAGLECWNGIRAIDYLLSRSDVDPDRIGVTGISGGGAASFWIAAADDRVKIAAPISGMGDLTSYVPNRCIKGHCDCMFLDNTYQWPWTRIAAMVAPRPLLFGNSDNDPLFPMDANERIINRLKRVYSLFGASDDVQNIVSIGEHAYRKDIRQAVYRFFNTHFKNDPRIVTDSEVDLVTEPRGKGALHPIPPEQLRVFPTDADIPKDAINAHIDESFVSLGHASGNEAVAQLRNLTFHHFPERVPAAIFKKRDVAKTTLGSVTRLTLETESPIVISAVELRSGERRRRIILSVPDPVHPGSTDWINKQAGTDDGYYTLRPRGIGETRWTRKNPPNYVERSLVLLARTADSGRVWDIIATARFLHEKYKVPVIVAGEKGAAILAACAAVLEPEIDGVMMHDAPNSFLDKDAPVLLNVLRVCDVPEIERLISPRIVNSK